jgi:hypothetical protein
MMEVCYYVNKVVCKERKLLYWRLPGMTDKQEIFSCSKVNLDHQP